MSFPNNDPQQNQVVNIKRVRKPRRKHKNSKLGCVQCKERRMKCDEELPQCKNCRIRQVKIPCSYLSLSEKEKEEFLQEKKKQKAVQSQSSPITSPQTSTSNESPRTASSHSTPKSNSSTNSITLKLVKHQIPSMLASQKQRFLGEADQSLQTRLFYIKIISASFLKFEEALTNHLAFVAYWLHLQLEKKVDCLADIKDYTIDSSDLDFLRDFTYQEKAKSIKELRIIVSNIIEAQERKDYRTALYHYSNFTIPTICLGCLDLLSQNSLKSYYIEGSLAVIKELYSATRDSSPIASFIFQAIGLTLSALFIPSYDFDVLYEIYDVLDEFGSIINNENDLILSMHYSRLMRFFNDYLIKSSLKSKFDGSYIIAYPPDMMYEVYSQFNKILPSEAFAINTMGSPVHRVYYSFYYMIGRVLDNVFPESRYISQHRFIGPTTVYPFQRSDVYGTYLPHELAYFANYSLRLLAFFSRRMELFNGYMKIKNPFPDKLPENRFHSRKTKKVQEIQITNFRSNILTIFNYPQPIKNRKTYDNRPSYDSYDNESPCSTDSFSSNFNSLFAMDNLGDTDAIDLEFIESKTGSLNPSAFVDLFDVDIDTGLLKSDYDPFTQDWGSGANEDQTPSISITKHLEDRSLLMRDFTKNN